MEVAGATTVIVTNDTLTAELSDGRTTSVPLAWCPRLAHAAEEERGIGTIPADWDVVRLGMCAM